MLVGEVRGLGLGLEGSVLVNITGNTHTLQLHSAGDNDQ